MTPHGRSVFRQSPSHICAGTGSGPQGKPPFGRFLGAACGRLSPHKNPKRRPIFIYSAYSHFFRRKYRTSSTTTATATTMMTG